MTGNGSSWRRVDLDGVGAVEVREVRVRDTIGVDLADLGWIHAVVRHVDGRPFTRDEVLDLPLSAGNALAQAVMDSHPTRRPSAASGG